MSLYLREKLKDAASSCNNSESSFRVDFEVSIKKLRNLGVVGRAHIRALYLYVIGYSLSEIEVELPNANSLLYHIMSQLAHEMGYGDENILNLAVERNPQLLKTKRHFRRQLRNKFQDFSWTPEMELEKGKK